MFYRITLDLAFTEITNPDKVKTAAKSLLSQAVVINEGQENEERGFITLQKCYHDEGPAIPCEVIAHYQVA